MFMPESAIYNLSITQIGNVWYLELIKGALLWIRKI